MKKITRRWDWWLVGILILAAWFYAWNIWEAGSANDYYTAAITSMVKSWHNFWYGAFDPAGFITVDKPPVSLWFMAISAKIFGVHGWSVVLPSILFGIGSVALIYFMVSPVFGKWSGRLAAFAMVVTPIVVADSRTNNMDATLVFFLILAGFLLQKAIKQRHPWLVLVSFGLIGVAFNIKMLQAFMVLPAMYFFYWLAAKQRWFIKVGWLAIATAVMAALTLAWPVSVNSTSSSQRPYVGSSQTNSELELAFGYNGTQRLLGQSTGTGGTFSGMSGQSKGSQSKNSPGNNAKPSGKSTSPTSPKSGQGNLKKVSGMTGNKPTAGKMGGGQAGGGGGAFNIGTAGPLRLFQSELGPEISWFLPLALVGFIGAYAYYYDRKRKWYQTNEQQQQLWYWLGWLAPVAGFFSVAQFFHPYYTIMLAPPLAVLFGIGLPILFKQARGKYTRWQTYLLPIGVAFTVGLQAWYVSSYYAWLSVLLIIAGIILIIGLLAFRKKRLEKALLIGTLATVMAAPIWWSMTPTLSGESAGIPSAGPSLLSNGGNANGGIGSGSVDSGLLKYVTKHQGSAKYLFGTTDASTAAPYIIKTGKAVMALGGFNGDDPTLTLKQFKQLVAKGEIKYFYVGNKSGNSAIINWIKKYGTKISSSKYNSSTTSQKTSSTGQPNSRSGMQPGGTAGGAPSGKMTGQKPSGQPGAKTGRPSMSTSKNKQSATTGGMGGMSGSGTLYRLSVSAAKK